MAVTKIWAIKDSLQRVLDYAANPDKTEYDALAQTLHYTGFRIPKLLFIKGNVGILLILQFHHLGDDGLYSGIVFHKLHGLVDHQIFQPLFTDSLFLAALVLFGSSTFIIAVNFSRPARAAFTKHQRPTVAAEQLGGKQVVILCLSTGRGFLIFGNLFLHILKQFQRDDGRMASGTTTSRNFSSPMYRRFLSICSTLL